MFGDIPVPQKRSGGSGWVSNVKALYQDPFKWQLVKSWVFFGAGIVMARELAAMEWPTNPAPSV